MQQRRCKNKTRIIKCKIVYFTLSSRCITCVTDMGYKYIYPMSVTQSIDKSITNKQIKVLRQSVLSNVFCH